MSLLKFEEASRRLRAAARSYRGIQPVPLDRIVGSVDRSEEFDRAFRVRGSLSRHRLDALRHAVDPEVDVCRLLHTEQHQQLLEETGLAQARPDADIRFTLLDGYTQLRDVIDAYGYRLSRKQAALVSADEVAAQWYDTEYLPGLEAIRRADLPRLYASWSSTDGDLFLWVYQLRRDLQPHDDKIDFAAAAQHARGVHLGYAR